MVKYISYRRKLARYDSVIRISIKTYMPPTEIYLPQAVIYERMESAWTTDTMQLNIDMARGLALERFAHAPNIATFLSQFAMLAGSTEFDLYQFAIRPLRALDAQRADILKIDPELEQDSNDDAYTQVEGQMRKALDEFKESQGILYRIAQFILREEAIKRFDISLPTGDPLLRKWSTHTVYWFNSEQSPDPLENIEISLGGTGLPFGAFASFVMLKAVQTWQQQGAGNRLQEQFVNRFTATSQFLPDSKWTAHQRDLFFMDQIVNSCYGKLC